MNDFLKTNKTDIAALLARSSLGAIPYVGPLLSEIINEIIPNQKLHRLIEFAYILDQKISHIEQNFVKSEFRKEDCSDFIEEGLRQASRAISKERKEYVASIIANSLSLRDIDYNESKHLLRILGEINDIEVIWLRYHVISTIGGDEEFRKKHAAVLEHIFVNDNETSQNLFDKFALQDSYKGHLVQLGLLETIYQKDTRTKEPKYDTHTGGLKKQSLNITPLGRLLLRQIAL